MAKKASKNEEIMIPRTCSSHDQNATRQRRILRAAAAFLGKRRRVNPPPARVDARIASRIAESRQTWKFPARDLRIDGTVK